MPLTCNSTDVGVRLAGSDLLYVTIRYPVLSICVSQSLPRHYPLIETESLPCLCLSYPDMDSEHGQYTVNILVSRSKSGP
jgi:hypothetical protein